MRYSTRIMPHCIGVLLLALICNPAQAVDISNASEKAPLRLDAALEFHKARHPEESLHEVLTRNTDFNPAPDEGVNFGFTSDAYWYRLRLENASGQRASRVLEIAYPPLDSIDIHVHHADGRRNTILTGDQRPIAEGQVKHRFYVIPLQFAPNEALTVYLRVKTAGSHQLPVSLWHVRAFVEKSETENMSLGLLFGMLIMMAIYNGFVGLSTRDPGYLVYFLVTSSFGILQANLNGYAYQYLTPALGLPAQWINVSVPVLSGIGMLTIILFARVFLDTPRSMPRLNIAINIQIALLGLLAVAGFFVAYRYVVPTAAALAIPGSITCITAGIIALGSGNRLSRLYLLAWSAMLLGIVVKMTELFGILPTSFLTTYAWQIGLLLTVTLLSLALSDRINLERKDKITAQEEALRAREESIQALGRYQRIVENVLEGVFECDANGRVLSANVSVANMVGYESPETMIQSVQDLRLDHVSDRDVAQQLTKQLVEEEQIFDHEVQLRRCDGSTFWATISMRVNHDEAGNISGFDGIVRDISERREKLRLEKEKAIADAATQAKSEFLAKMSHELRTPMNAVIGFTDLAKRSDSDARRLEHLDSIDSASHSLLNIINDILDLSKVEAGKLTLETREFELRPILDRVGNVIAPRASEKGLEVIISSAPDVPNCLVGDPLRLEQVLTNLMGNAAKFTEQGEIELRAAVESLGEETNRLCFSVRDTGIGLNEEQRLRLFKPFSQADDSTTRRYGGTGLGLAICKQLVELMAGEISVESQPGHGSTFAFTAQFGVAGLESESPEDTLPSGLRILVVDDNAAAREVYSEILLSLKLETVAVDSGPAALLALKKNHFDAALIDWQMPDMDGLELCRQIRQAGKTRDLPIVLMTAYGHEDLAGKTKELGVSACLEKPVKPSPLLEALLEAIGLDAGVETPQKPQTTTQNISLHGLRILLTEDNPLNQRLASEILHSAGADLDIANNGQEALDKVPAGHYDLILMDVQMPVMDGLQATRQIRSQEKGEHIPIIAMTANAMESDRDNCLGAGMDDFIAKPINANDLLMLIARYQPQDKALRAAPASATANPGDSDLMRLQDLPGIAIRATMERIGGRPQLLVELLQDLVGEQRDVAAGIRQALSQANIEQALHMTHTLKGLAANCGCNRLADTAQQIEDVIKTSGQAEDSLLGELQAAMDEVADSVNRLPEVDQDQEVRQAGDAPAETFSDAALDRLETMLEAGDFSVADQLEALRESLNEHLTAAAADQLANAVRRFDYDTALTVLQTARAGNSPE